MNKLDEKVYCSSCEKKTNHGKLMSHRTQSDPKEDFEWISVYHIVQCLGCDKISFVNEYSDVTYFYQDEDGGFESFVDYTVYPEEPNGSNISTIVKRDYQEYTNVPNFIKDLYFQVIDAFNFKSLLLCAVGLRTLIEAICKDLNVVDGFLYDESGEIEVDKNGHQKRSDNLYGKINGILEKGVITNKQSKILHQVRELGNYAVHEIEAPNRATVRGGIEIIENILHNIYELDKYDVSPRNKKK
jgi:hypothetical protein